jgi:hypothetical protein
MKYLNTKWDQSDWSIEQKTQWQKAVFALGYGWTKQKHSPSNLDGSFFYLTDNKHLSYGTTREWFNSNGRLGLTESYWEDMFPAKVPHELLNKEGQPVTAELEGEEPVSFLETAAARKAIFEEKTGTQNPSMGIATKGNPKYDVTITGKHGTGSCVVDVYRVLAAFSVTNPQMQHLTKKALKVGGRGHKDTRQDLVDIIHSAQSALDMFDDME